MIKIIIIIIIILMMMDIFIFLFNYLSSINLSYTLAFVPWYIALFWKGFCDPVADFF